MRGFVSLIVIVIVLLIAFLLMRSQIGSQLSGGGESGGRTAVDAAKSRAAEVERLQRERLKDAEQLSH